MRKLFGKYFFRLQLLDIGLKNFFSLEFEINYALYVREQNLTKKIAQNTFVLKIGMGLQLRWKPT